MANDISKKTESTFIYQTTEDVRRQPIFLNPENHNWIELLKDHIADKRTWQKIEDNEDIKEKQAALSHSPEIYEELFSDTNIAYPVGYDSERIKAVVERAISSNILGSAEISCPPGVSGDTTFQVFGKNAKEIGTKTLECNCPVCHKHVQATISMGKIHCPECGSSANYNC